MILTALDQTLAYRMHTPKWAGSPTSGAGAALHGGRANRPGIAALYLALDIGTAIKEYQQVSTLLPPGTLVSYRLNLSAWWIFGKATSQRNGRRFGKNFSVTGVNYGSTSAWSRRAGCWGMRR